MSELNQQQQNDCVNLVFDEMSLTSGNYRTMVRIDFLKSGILYKEDGTEDEFTRLSLMGTGQTFLLHPNGKLEEMIVKISKWQKFKNLFKEKL